MIPSSMSVTCLKREEVSADQHLSPTLCRCSVPESHGSGELAAHPVEEAQPSQPVGDLGPFSLERTTSFEIPDEEAHAADTSEPIEIDMREPSTAMALKVWPCLTGCRHICSCANPATSG
jgi:hypothetical protein